MNNHTRIATGKRFFCKAVAVAVATNVAGFSAQSMAQEGRLATMLEEVTVTARKREEGMQDAPLSVSAFSGDGLQARGIENIAEVGALTPNMTFQNNPQAGGSSSVATVYIRGVGQRDFLGTIDSGVGFYIDDVYIARTVGALVDLVDVERVEVLRGPQGTLFGRNNVGGALALHSKKPEDSFGGYLSATVGSDAKQRVNAGINLPLSDNLLTAFSFLAGKQDGYVTRTDGADLGDDDVQAFRGSVYWTPTDRLSVRLSADYSREEENGPAFVLVDVDEVGQFGNGFPGFHNNVLAGDSCAYAQFGPFREDPACYNDQWTGELNQGTAPTYSNTDNWGVTLGVEWEISDTLSLKSITAHRDLDAEFARDSDASPLTITHFYDAFESEQFSQEIQVLGTALDGALDWIGGLYYFDEDGYNQNILNFAIADFDSRNVFSSTSKAAFAQVTYHWAESLHVTLGLRYSDEEKMFSPNQRVLQSNIGIPAGTLILPLGENTIEASESTPLLNVSWDLNDTTMVYANYAQGFRSGGFVQRIFPPRPDVVSFAPEYVDSYELGIKYRSEQGDLQINAAAFQMDYDDIQVRVPAGVAQVEQNVGEAEISGLELEIKWAPIAHWFIESGVGYTNAKFTKIDIDVSSIPRNPDGSLSVDLDDPFAVIQANNEFDHVPEWSANISVAHDVDLGEQGDLVVRLSANYHSGYFNEPLNLPQLETPELTLWDMNVSWTSAQDRYRINAGVKNLSDERYRATGYFNPTIGNVENLLARGREWFISARWNY